MLACQNKTPLVKKRKQGNHVIRKKKLSLAVMRKNGHPLKSINHDQFLTKYFNRLTDQPLSKHYRVRLDLDGLRTPRYLQITERATKRVSVLFVCLISIMQVRGRHCEKWAKLSYLQLNKNRSNSVPIVATF